MDLVTSEIHCIPSKTPLEKEKANMVGIGTAFSF
jgi:hypothetical protein